MFSSDEKECAACFYVFNVAEIFLMTNGSVSEAESILRLACNIFNTKFPSSGAACDEFVNQYYPILLEAILT